MNNTLQGFAFPFVIDGRTGGVATAADSDKLRQNLKHLFLTRIGERAMLRTYGGGVTGLFQENINDGLVAVAQHQVAKAMMQFEPRVVPQQITVTGSEGQLYLIVRYLEPDTPALQQTSIPLG